jgi:hypothetical protein
LQVLAAYLELQQRDPSLMMTFRTTLNIARLFEQLGDEETAISLALLWAASSANSRTVSSMSSVLNRQIVR